jgi:hypothetical protein
MISNENMKLQIPDWFLDFNPNDIILYRIRFETDRLNFKNASKYIFMYIREFGFDSKLNKIIDFCSQDLVGYELSNFREAFSGEYRKLRKILPDEKLKKISKFSYQIEEHDLYLGEGFISLKANPIFRIFQKTLKTNKSFNDKLLLVKNLKHDEKITNQHCDEFLSFVNLFEYHSPEYLLYLLDLVMRIVIEKRLSGRFWAVINSMRGITYKNMGNFNDAYLYLFSAREIFKGKGRKIEAAQCDLAIANIDEYFGKFNEALFIYKNIKKLFKEKNNDSLVASCNMHIADVYR